MNELKNNNITYNSVLDSAIGRKHLAIQKITDRMMKSQKITTITGVLLFTIFHPSAMINAQKYYSKDFGKPCTIKSGK